MRGPGSELEPQSEILQPACQIQSHHLGLSSVQTEDPAHTGLSGAGWLKLKYIILKQLEDTKKCCLLLYLVYFTTPGNAQAPQTQGREKGAVADSGHVRVWTKGKYIRVQDAPDHGKTVAPAGGDAAADGYHPTIPES